MLRIAARIPKPLILRRICRAARARYSGGLTFDAESAAFQPIRNRSPLPRCSTVLNRIREIVKWGGAEALSSEPGNRPILFVGMRAWPPIIAGYLGGLRCTPIFAADARNAPRGLYWRNGRSPCTCCIGPCGRGPGIRSVRFAARHLRRNVIT